MKFKKMMLSKIVQRSALSFPGIMVGLYGTETGNSVLGGNKWNPN